MHRLSQQTSMPSAIYIANAIEMTIEMTTENITATIIKIITNNHFGRNRRCKRCNMCRSSWQRFLFNVTNNDTSQKHGTDRFETILMRSYCLCCSFCPCCTYFYRRTCFDDSIATWRNAHRSPKVTTKTKMSSPRSADQGELEEEMTTHFHARYS